MLRKLRVKMAQKGKKVVVKDVLEKKQSFN